MKLKKIVDEMLSEAPSYRPKVAKKPGEVWPLRVHNEGPGPSKSKFGAKNHAGVTRYFVDRTAATTWAAGSEQAKTTSTI